MVAPVSLFNDFEALAQGSLAADLVVGCCIGVTWGLVDIVAVRTGLSEKEKIIGKLILMNVCKQIYRNRKARSQVFRGCFCIL